MTFIVYVKLAELTFVSNDTQLPAVATLQAFIRSDTVTATGLYFRWYYTFYLY